MRGERLRVLSAHTGDKDLVRRMLAGEEGAFDEFFHEYFPRLYRFALNRLGHDAREAEEVAQSTLCRAVTKIGTFQGEATLFTWLCTFCRHEIYALKMRENRRPHEVALLEETPDISAALESLAALFNEGPESRLHRKEIARLVRVALDHLPARYGRALEWKYIEGLPVKEIADRLGTSPKAAESLLTRAREAFRDGFGSLVTPPMGPEAKRC
jgi:RNA polymerase sigma-70 factor (ECF subfamily)